MQTRLPEKCDLFQLADKSAVVIGSWPVAKMPRLLSMLASDTGEVSVECNFARKGRTRYLKGTATVTVDVQCQRCMGTMALPIEANFSLGLIETEAQIERLTDEFEPLITEGPHYLPDVIEDELILEIPIVPRHDNDCSSYIKDQQESAETHEAVEDKKPNPFAVLKDML